MPTLPHDFLTHMAVKYELTPEQQEAFVELFSTNKSQESVAADINLSANAFRTRMSGVYSKFSYSGKGPGKYHKLRNFLVETYQKSNLSKSNIDIDSLVQEVRQKIRSSIQQRCGTMRVLDMSQPIGLNDIYTNVNILEKITGRRRKEIDELLQECKSENFERFGLGRITEERVPGLEAVHRHSKLMVLGKPGAGKTTFLKHLAIQCICGKFQADRVPIFITLKQFAETDKQPDLMTFIIQQLTNDVFSDVQISKLVKSGQVLILLDGLDEVREEDNSRILRQIKEFSDQNYMNQFVITCRIAARDYTFEQFTEVEIADFDNQQIADFSTKWFQIKDPVKAEKFIQRLQENEPIQDLATNPLLLTLLCLVFEELADFPSNRAELYKEGLDVLLKKWDVKRNIEREQVYKKLSVQRKEDLLSLIALTTFERGDYFFKQKEVEQHINNYIRNLPNVSADSKALQLDSEAVLKSIEAQHGLLVECARGIYSFSHLTFHEYFTANKIVSSPPSQVMEQLQNLVNRITEKRWREVLLLTVGILPVADDLLQLMKDKIDALLISNNKLQQFLTWVNEKSRSVKLPYKPAVVRSFYFNLGRCFARDRNLALDLALNCNLAFNRDLDLAFNLAFNLALERSLDLTLPLERSYVHAFDLTLALERDHDLAFDLVLVLERDHDLALDLALNLALDFALNLARAPALGGFLARALDLALNHVLNSQLQRALQKLKAQLLNPEWHDESYLKWWQDNGQNWTEQLRAVMIEYHSISHNWQFSEEQQQLLKQYYDANQLLVDCLNSARFVTRTVREKFEATLLLPIEQIQINSVCL